MRCAVCSGLLLFDRIERESRCLICGRTARREHPPELGEPDHERREYPRRYGTPRERPSDCWG